MFNEKRFLVSLLANLVIDWNDCDGNSLSFSFDTIRKKAWYYDLSIQYMNNDEILNILQEAEDENFIMSVEKNGFGVDNMFSNEYDEESYENGTLTEKDGVMISLSDDSWYSTFEDFYYNESKYYDGDCMIDTFIEYEKLKPFRELPEDIDYLKMMLKDNQSPSIQFLIYLKLVELISKDIACNWSEKKKIESNKWDVMMKVS